MEVQKETLLHQTKESFLSFNNICNHIYNLSMADKLLGKL